MLKTNLKLALRNIFTNKLYSAINIIGLGVASAFCILVYLYVKNEQSFDRFHHDQSQLFRLEQTEKDEPAADKKSRSLFSFLMKDEEQQNMIVTPTELAIDIKRNFAEVENAVRIGGMGSVNIRVGGRTFKENDNVEYVDADFFKVFNYPLVSGDKANVLAGRNTAAISERLAQKYFGKNDPVGKTVIFADDEKQPPITISGVFKNFPANSSFQYDLLVPMESDPNYAGNLADGLNSANKLLILKLKKNVDVNSFQQKFNRYAKILYKPYNERLKSQIPDYKVSDPHFILRPFADAHYNASRGWGHFTDLKNIYQLVCLAAVILLIACLNYVLLTLTNTVSRSQDVGIRKTIGASKKQIIFKYYFETQLLAFMAVITGLLIATACMPFFSRLTGTEFAIANFSGWTVAGLLLALTIALGLLAGIYPALVMSGLKPLNIMRGFSAYRISPFLSKSLVIIQFTICVVLVISALAINKQMHFISSADMGFDKELVLRVENPYGWNSPQKANVLNERLRHFAEIDPKIQDVTSSSFSFGLHSMNNFYFNGEKTIVQFLNVDYNYFDFNKIPIIKGRNFSRDIATDSLKTVIPDLEKSHKGSLARHTIIVNQTLYNLLGKPELGVINRTMGGMIIGVCKDYHTADLTKKIEPAYHTVNYGDIYSYYIKIKPGQNIPETITDIRNNWDKLTGNLPFNFTFVDQDIAKSYDAYLRWMTTITTSCILAIIIACLGLFGLSGLTTINRTKEIGIRKVLGASVSNLFLLLNRGVIRLAIGSFVIATPVAFYLVHQWLDNFAYRIKPDWTLFTVAGIIALSTAVLAVSYHTVRAAIANPVKSLRNE
ncbi:ABC transporter permease [Mucilaginibacter sp. L3T2-6]|uniref:ABC transporter permease n=1 Tax=Mucilaginibacter sp. L3T2-6 TaxID=3062491 RepID=UPI00267486B1|nr:ABC transporter permease [Mucilaginibacter sp. L3T2-6]MDO3644969.1 ABC transporter permease [Mucilaginibacter sp. L3T2-6]MDV6217405.1 ABC transporter permease [Mucilaginibacter sp. L3T2-6]